MAKRSPEDDVQVAIEEENRVNGSYDDAEEDDDNEAHHHQHQHQQRKKKKKKKRKVRIMTASDQTDADRRVLRRRQRELHTDISFDAPAAAASASAAATNDSSEDDNDEDETKPKSTSTSGLLSWREKNNALWDDVRYTREAVLDSENMDLISSKAAREVEKIIQVPRYDAITLAQNLVKKGSIRTGNIHQFNWAGLGFQVGVCFSSLPSNCTFLYGPLDAEYTPKERKKAERKKRAQEADEEMENLEETRPESKDQQGGKKAGEGDGNELSAVEQHIRTINKTIMNRAKVEYKSAKEQVGSYLTQCKQEGITEESELTKKQKNYLREARKVGAVNCLFNPKSFTQTVENIFHFSFSVKTGKAEIKTRGLKEAEEYGLEPGPVAINKDLEQKPVPKQAIVSLNMKDWRDMCAAYSVEESDVPHREVETPAKKRARTSM
eukprot:CAMPEP_0201713992 /NCGR_PEP_ID=MMETSP0593-20130828/635_1 /ASSEMBLY_ACC=CAM_ASM_000672 /TAXON_ID=267983 /ORGANISM="Skeletonema japonicum, Strain CCMP2506" /LENGTH=437 /DNA_ID=CAMNT_0048203213 /DNA_START=24 /DNA_END=1337 /DNA_ORIENTATION=-